MDAQRSKQSRIREAPADAVALDALCMRAVLSDEHRNPEGPHKAHITASAELGVFSIRDMEANVMLTVTLKDAMAVVSAATEWAQELEEAAGGTE